jgi:hypothetical protein
LRDVKHDVLTADTSHCLLPHGRRIMSHHRFQVEMLVRYGDRQDAVLFQVPEIEPKGLLREQADGDGAAGKDRT